ncbi:Pyosin/cloacin translocation domain-containing protein [Xenorhabdus nematophila]
MCFPSRRITQHFQDQIQLLPRQSAMSSLTVEPSIDYSRTLVDKLPDSSLVIRNTVIIYPASDDSDDGIQDEPFVGCIQIFPKEVPESLQFGCKTVFPAAELQSPETFSRFPPIAGKPQKVKRWQASARLTGSQCCDVSRRN